MPATADLFIMLGLAGETTVSRISWPVYRAVLRVLRPAESALRRLIVVAARGLVVKPSASRLIPAGAKRTWSGRRGASCTVHEAHFVVDEGLHCLHAENSRRKSALAHIGGTSLR